MKWFSIILLFFLQKVNFSRNAVVFRSYVSAFSCWVWHFQELPSDCSKGCCLEAALWDCRYFLLGARGNLTISFSAEIKEYMLCTRCSTTLEVETWGKYRRYLRCSQTVRHGPVKIVCWQWEWRRRANEASRLGRWKTNQDTLSGNGKAWGECGRMSRKKLSR